MARGVKLVEIADETVNDGSLPSGFEITMSTEEANRTGSVGRRQKYAILWQQVGQPKDKLFRSSLINVAAVEKKCNLVDEKTGKPIWYRQIPRGGRPEAVEPKYKCPVCAKRFAAFAVESSNGNVIPGSFQLDDHVRRVHSKASYERWAPMLRKLMATAVVDPVALFADPDDAEVEVVKAAPDVPAPIEPGSLEIQ